MAITEDSSRLATDDTLQIEASTVFAASPVSLLDDDTVASPSGSGAKRSRRRFGPRTALVCSDVAVTVLCEILALSLVHKPASEVSSSGTWANVALAAALPLVVLLSFSLRGADQRWPSQLLKSSFSELSDTIYALSLTGCVVLGLNHFVRPILGSRLIYFEPVTIVTALLFAAAAIPSGRALTRLALRAAGCEQCRVLILGSGTMVTQLLKYLSWDPRITVVGCVDDDPRPGTVVLGPTSQLPAIVDALSVDEVIVGFSRTHPEEAIHKLQSLNSSVAISIVPRYFELLSWRSAMKDVAGLPLISVAPPNLSLAARVTKRTFDVVAASVMLVLGLPVLTAAAIAIKVTSTGPVLFRQQRVGQDGKTFQILKLRTMETGAHAQHRRLSEAHSANGELFKMRNDPRVTRVGQLLRRLSIDELPQLVNVLQGEMSLVGPRPFIPEESRYMVGASARRFEVRPGITGLWQVSGRSQLSERELRRLDYLYVASWSFWWDLRILCQTPAQVVKGRGAL
ncbi:MAG: sugar transferase [Acidimicrobiales bacterium]